MVTVFIPHLQDKNRYLDEIITYSKATFIYGNYKEYKNHYSIVNIQFPEAIFDWKMPTQEQLLELEDYFVQWKKHSKIVYTMNDLKEHCSDDIMFDKLFELVHKYADGVVHMGNFSLKEYASLFSQKCQHIVIYHPIYVSLAREDFKTSDVQKIIPVKLNGKYIVSVIGSIRSKKEMKLVLNIFKNIKTINKVLILPRVSQLGAVPKWLPCRFRKLYRNMATKISFYSIKGSEYYVANHFLEYEYLVDLVQKSNLLIIPRVDNLNSGNLFLGLTFKKNMLVPAVGNLSEVLHLFKIPYFNFKKINKSVVNDFIIALENEPYYKKEVFIRNREQFLPENIAKKLDAYFKALLIK